MSGSLIIPCANCGRTIFGWRSGHANVCALCAVQDVAAMMERMDQAGEAPGGPIEYFELRLAGAYLSQAAQAFRAACDPYSLFSPTDGLPTPEDVMRDYMRHAPQRRLQFCRDATLYSALA